jgi:hypothetical protein
MSSFGTPTFGGPAPANTSPATPQTNGVAQPGLGQPSQGVGGVGAVGQDAAPLPIIDENDPRLTSEILDINPAGDAFASPPPPPDGAYRVKLKLEGYTDAQGTKKDYGATLTKGGGGNPQLPYLTTGLSASIIDPSGKFDGIVVYPPFGGNVGTLVGKDGSSKVSTILSKIKRPDGTTWNYNFQGNHQGWMKRFVEAMASEPEVGVVTQWEGSCQICGEEAKKTGARYPKGVQGMTHFPLEADKKKAQAQGHSYSPDCPCPIKPKEHGYFKARSVIVKFLSLEELTTAQRG